MGTPVVFFDMTIGGAPAGRIEMTLRADVVPKTAEVLTAMRTAANSDDVEWDAEKRVFQRNSFAPVDDKLRSYMDKAREIKKQFGVVPQEEGGPLLELHQFRVGLARLLAAGVVDDLARLDRRDDARPAAHLLPVRGAPHRAEVAAAPARSEKNRPNAANNRGRRVIAAQETERFGAVLKDARFRADPLGAVLGHLRATLPAPPAFGVAAAAAAAARCGGICTLVPKWVLSALAERFWDVGSGAQGLLRALRRRVGLVRVCQVGSRTGANTVSAPRPRYLAIVEGRGLRTFPTSTQTRTTTVEKR